MRSKKLGRHDLLCWVNTVTQSDFSKIENLSDGVAFCQIFDAFYPNVFNLNQLKLNSKNPEEWEKNLGIVNDILSKLKSFKQIDPAKLSQCKFTHNFEFLQFIYDYIAKNCGEGTIRYSAYDKRLEIIKSQNSSKLKNNYLIDAKITDIRKFLPSHLIPNDLILKMEKKKYFGDIETNNLPIQKDKVGFSTPTNNLNTPKGFDLNSKNYSSSANPTLENNCNPMLEKYKEFFEILKEDMKSMMDNNMSLSREIEDVEEERLYYLDKLKNVLKFCDENREKSNMVIQESEKVLQNIEAIIKHQPEDFK